MGLHCRPPPPSSPPCATARQLAARSDRDFAVAVVVPSLPGIKREHGHVLRSEQDGQEDLASNEGVRDVSLVRGRAADGSCYPGGSEWTVRCGGWLVARYTRFGPPSPARMQLLLKEIERIAREKGLSRAEIPRRIHVAAEVSKGKQRAAVSAVSQQRPY
jgi:hypothetical protein